MIDPMSELKNGVVLAEIGSHSDGPWCAEYGAGAALVVLGTFIVDARDDVPYNPDFVFKPGRENYGDYLDEHVAAARDSGAAVGVSVVSVNLDDTIDFLRAAEEAGTELQPVVYDSAASDASLVYAVGGAHRVACLGHVRENSHGYEVARLSVFDNLFKTLVQFIATWEE